jgi:hypothetical protein
MVNRTGARSSYRKAARREQYRDALEDAIERIVAAPAHRPRVERGDSLRPLRLRQSPQTEQISDKRSLHRFAVRRPMKRWIRAIRPGQKRIRSQNRTPMGARPELSNQWSDGGKP